MNKMNLGCGPDVLEGFLNVDVRGGDGIERWDSRADIPEDWKEQFDFILVNHVLCTMNPNDVMVSLFNIRDLLKDGGTVQIIDMNMLKAYEDYYQNNAFNIPIEGNDADFKLAMHVSGYGTRLSLFTPNLLAATLQKAGFRGARILDESEYDLRPKESLIVEGVK